MSRYSMHSCLDIEGALRRPGYWRKAIRVDGQILSTDAFRSFLCERMREGKTAISFGCPTPNADGTCPTHPLPDEPPTMTDGIGEP